MAAQYESSSAQQRNNRYLKQRLEISHDKAVAAGLCLGGANNEWLMVLAGSAGLRRYVVLSWIRRQFCETSLPSRLRTGGKRESNALRHYSSDIPPTAHRVNTVHKNGIQHIVVPCRAADLRKSRRRRGGLASSGPCAALRCTALHYARLAELSPTYFKIPLSRSQPTHPTTPSSQPPTTLGPQECAPSLLDDRSSRP